MSEILQNQLPQDMQNARALPGVQPLAPDGWIRVDDAYAAQMAHRRALIADRHTEVIRIETGALLAAQEALEETLAILPALGFTRLGGAVECPDAVRVELDFERPMETLGRLIQEDVCVLQKTAQEHRLTAAVLCFPASWSLAEKAGRPLGAIHDPVESYDGQMARRVQRLFDCVRPGRPLWRFNQLWYSDPELHQPRSAAAPCRDRPANNIAPYQRAERQSIVRMPRTDAVVFSIHTYVVKQP